MVHCIPSPLPVLLQLTFHLQLNKKVSQSQNLHLLPGIQAVFYEGAEVFQGGAAAFLAVSVELLINPILDRPEAHEGFGQELESRVCRRLLPSSWMQCG